MAEGRASAAQHQREAQRQDRTQHRGAGLHDGQAGPRVPGDLVLPGGFSLASFHQHAAVLGLLLSP